MTTKSMNTKPRHNDDLMRYHETAAQLTVAAGIYRHLVRSRADMDKPITPEQTAFMENLIDRLIEDWSAPYEQP